MKGLNLYADTKGESIKLEFVVTSTGNRIADLPITQGAHSLAKLMDLQVPDHMQEEIQRLYTIEREALKARNAFIMKCKEELKAPIQAEIDVFKESHPEYFI